MYGCKQLYTKICEDEDGIEKFKAQQGCDEIRSLPIDVELCMDMCV